MAPCQDGLTTPCHSPRLPGSTRHDLPDAYFSAVPPRPLPSPPADQHRKITLARIVAYWQRNPNG